jgi:hypothetical protein
MPSDNAYYAFEVEPNAAQGKGRPSALITVKGYGKGQSISGYAYGSGWIIWPVAGDIDEDGDVDEADLNVFMSAWLSEAGDAQWNPDCDISVPADNRIDILDFAALSKNWAIVTVPAIPGDFDKDGDVDVADLAAFALAWLTKVGDAQWNPDCDIKIPADNYINMRDFGVFSSNWGEVAVSVIPGDFDEDRDVDWTDLAIFTAAWLSETGDAQWNPDCDISVPTDNRIDMLDFVMFAGSWRIEKQGR